MTKAAVTPSDDCNLTITESAEGYLAELLEKQDQASVSVRVFVENPGTARAECCMAYCVPSEEKEDDIVRQFSQFKAYIDRMSAPYLLDAVIDYNKDRFGGQLTFKAPHSKMPRIGEDASLEERITYVLQTEINPSLAAHGGQVSLVELVENAAEVTAVLKFGGGCQGCSAVDITLKQGVETTLKAQIPQLTHVVDQTDHSQKEGAYFK